MCLIESIDLELLESIGMTGSLSLAVNMVEDT